MSILMVAALPLDRNDAIVCEEETFTFDFLQHLELSVIFKMFTLCKSMCFKNIFVIQNAQNQTSIILEWILLDALF